MNNKKGLPLIKKVLICLMTMIIVIMSVTIPSYATQIMVTYTPVLWSTSPVAAYTVLNSTIDDYIQELKEEGYEITSFNFDRDAIEKSTIQLPVLNKNTDTFTKSTLIRQILDIKITATQVTIDTESFYFKNSTDALAFVNKVNEQVETKYSMSEGVEINKDNLTDDATLETRIEKAKTEKQEIEQRQRELEQKKKQQQYKVTSRGGIPRISSSTTCFPVASYSYVSSSYGTRWGKLHTGIDLAAAKGTSVYAWKSGTVTLASWSGGYGNCILVKHFDGTTSRYAHLSGYNCSVGDYVAAGQTIGYVGSTGNSTGPHFILK